MSWIDKDGYIILTIAGKHIREHRMVMEKFLGRKLSKKETVHHINGNKKDNRIENLELCTNMSEHLKKHHSKVWNKGKVSIYEFNCKMCGKGFQAIRQKNRKYCGRKCSSMAASTTATEVNRKHYGCTVWGCLGKHAAKGFCKKHYYSAYNNGAYKSFMGGR